MLPGQNEDGETVIYQFSKPCYLTEHDVVDDV